MEHNGYPNGCPNRMWNGGAREDRRYDSRLPYNREAFVAFHMEGY